MSDSNKNKLLVRESPIHFPPAHQPTKSQNGRWQLKHINMVMMKWSRDRYIITIIVIIIIIIIIIIILLYYIKNKFNGMHVLRRVVDKSVVFSCEACVLRVMVPIYSWFVVRMSTFFIHNYLHRLCRNCYGMVFFLLASANSINTCITIVIAY